MLKQELEMMIMTWTVLLVTLLICIIKVLMTCLPTGVVEWLIKKFEMHAKLDEENVTMTKAGKILEGKEKKQVIDWFNNATVLERYTIIAGYNEKKYLEPEDGGNPIVIHAKRGKQTLKISLHSYHDRIDVVKQHKKKIVAYSLRSDHLQKQAMVTAGDLVCK